MDINVTRIYHHPNLASNPSNRKAISLCRKVMSGHVCAHSSMQPNDGHIAPQPALSTSQPFPSSHPFPTNDPPAIFRPQKGVKREMWNCYKRLVMETSEAKHGRGLCQQQRTTSRFREATMLPRTPLPSFRFFPPKRTKGDKQCQRRGDQHWR